MFRRGRTVVERVSKQLPDPGPIRPFSVPPVHSTKLSNGLGIMVARMPRFPVVGLTLVMDVTEIAVPPSAAGLAVLTANALQGGTERRGGAALAESLEGIGTSIATTSGWDSTRLSMSLVAERTPEALDLLAEVVRTPTFPDDEVVRTRDQRLAQIEHELADPRTLGDHSIARLVYAKGEPYGRRVGGSKGTVARFDTEAVRSFHHAEYDPSRACLVAAGDIDPEVLQRLCADRFGDWAGNESTVTLPTCEPRTRERRVTLVDRPGAVQSEIRIGHVGVPRSVDDYFDLRIFNAVLGGTFTSRLNLNLREEHGFTYGVRSIFGFRRAAGPFSVSTAVETAVTPLAVREAVTEIEQLVQDGPTEDEVDAARNYLAGVFPLQFETTEQVARQLGNLATYGLPDDYYETFRDRVRAVTNETAHAAGRAHVRPGELQVVVVGDAGSMRDDLEALDLGPVSVEKPQ
jgi:zinc protease